MTTLRPSGTVSPLGELNSALARLDDSAYRREAAHCHLVNELQALPGSKRALALASQVWNHSESCDVAHQGALCVLLDWVQRLGAKGA